MMKFVYVDVHKRNIVAVFQNETTGKNYFWTIDEVYSQKKKHQVVGGWKMIQQCDDAIDAMIDYKSNRKKPWWKFW